MVEVDFFHKPAPLVPAPINLLFKGTLEVCVNTRKAALLPGEKTCTAQILGIRFPLLGKGTFPWHFVVF